MKELNEILDQVSLEDIEEQEFREVRISVRTFPSISKWMKESKISPSRLFNACAKVLMEYGSNS